MNTQLMPKYAPGQKFTSKLVDQKPVYAMKTKKKKRTMGCTVCGHEPKRDVKWI